MAGHLQIRREDQMALDDRHSDKTFGMSTLFHCPTCTAKYEIVRVEAPPGPTTHREIVCIACGGPLHARQGKFLLKYFLVERPTATRLAATAVAQSSRKRFNL
jgi:hypothetical protein